MSKVIDCARALGEAIVASEEYKRMQIAEAAATNDPTVAEATGRYLELKGMLDACMREDEPNAELIARYGMEMDEVQRQMNAMSAVDEMTSARQAFSAICIRLYSSEATIASPSALAQSMTLLMMISSCRFVGWIGFNRSPARREACSLPRR